MPKTKYVADWLTRAEEDISTAQLLRDQRGSANIICFHAQQAIKAASRIRNIILPKMEID